MATKKILVIFLVLFSFNTVYSISDYKKRLKLNKTYHYYKVMGDRYRVLGDYTKSIREYEYAIAINPRCAECYYYLGKIKYKKGIYVEAIKELNIATNKKFKYYYDKIKSYYLLASIYFKISREAKAIDVLKNITKEYHIFKERSIEVKLIDFTHYAPAFFLIGLYLRNNGFLNDKNLNYLFKSMELNFKKDYCNYFLYEYYKGKQPDVAFRYLNQAMTVNPNIQLELQKAEWLKTYKIFDEIDY